jgi:glycyl-tRNA synthetase beta subunit
MAELFIELFSEEIPSKLQIDARQKIKEMIDEKLKKKGINFKSGNAHFVSFELFCGPFRVTWIRHFNSLRILRDGDTRDNIVKCEGIV